MAELTDAEIDAALERGRLENGAFPSARSARYEPTTDRIIVELADASSLEFAASRVQGLEDATPEQLADIELTGSGRGLRWPAKDVDLSVSGLLEGRFGSAAHMASLAEQGRLRRAG